MYYSNNSNPHFKLIHRKLYVVPPNLKNSKTYYRVYILNDGTLAYKKNKQYHKFYLEPPKHWTHYAFNIKY